MARILALINHLEIIVNIKLESCGIYELNVAKEIRESKSSILLAFTNLQTTLCLPFVHNFVQHSSIASFNSHWFAQLRSLKTEHSLCLVGMNLSFVLVYNRNGRYNTTTKHNTVSFVCHSCVINANAFYISNVFG